ncbi:hypothetical protein EDB89DRAFT_1170790 [Lactarius sanguifluus]|nr:hypothetical protein EDB89DRAFT_1170790 [Lactarius sanguifluus]
MYLTLQRCKMGICSWRPHKRPQPGPRHRPLREAVVSFMTSHQRFGHYVAVEYEQRRHISELRGTGPLSRQALNEVLPDDVLLRIFQHYLDASPRRWPELAHVCRSWRQIIFASPLGLQLRLYCTYGTPILKNLASWPSLPLALDYVGSPMLRPPSPEDEDNIMAAVEQSDRVCSINLTVSSSLLKKLSAISEPFSELEELVLLSQDNVQSTLSRASAFWWGHRLRILHSTRIAIPSLPQLLLPSQNLVDLQLHDIPRAGYFSPEAFANALCGMTQLETLSLHFLSLPPRRNYIGLPPPPGDHVVLPALTRFKYRGISKYLDNLVARIDAPRLEEIDITFFNQPTLDASQLGLFINRTETWEPPLRARIISSEDAISISITFTQPVAFEQLSLQISCERLDWQLSSITQICDHFPSSLSSVEDLGFETIGPSNASDDTDDEHWLRLICTFEGIKDFHVVGKHATDILHALHPADEGQKIVLPSLRKLHLLRPTSVQGPLLDSVESLGTQRQLSGHPVEIYYMPHPATDADYQALLANIPSSASALTATVMSILPRFSHTSGAELEGHRVPPHIVAFLEQHRDNLQRAAQDQNVFRAYPKWGPPNQMRKQKRKRDEQADNIKTDELLPRATQVLLPRSPT